MKEKVLFRCAPFWFNYHIEEPKLIPRKDRYVSHTIRVNHAYAELTTAEAQSKLLKLFLEEQ